MEISNSQRIDIWLWHARFYKTRSLATKICRAGKVRINGQKITKASAMVVAGHVLTFVQPNIIRIVKVLDFASRRGGAPEAQTLYEDMTPSVEVTRKADQDKVARRERGSGRPTKTERRATDRLKGKFLDID
ncbi:MAG: RNA-binding S4 domain-containing protein [Emcibacter sp.]|nr:RNA-binding S4 domain-containing protein [Emcibacter sp.]